MEERSNERFEVTKGLSVSFSTNDAPNITRLAEIIDVSMGGLAIKYRSRRNNTDGLARLTILTGNDLTLSCQGVYDGERTWEGHDSISPVRRCGVKFANLSKGQIRQLRNFIRDYTYAPPLHP
ncbi:MAG: PilZ domain-containing protein [Syntrophobacteraceae bacterium]